MPCDRISRWEWRRRFRNPLLIVALAVIYATLLEVCSELSGLLWRFQQFNLSSWDGVGGYLLRLQFMTTRSLFTPLPWIATTVVWVAIRRDQRTGRTRDLRLSPLRARELFWIKIPPLALAICLIVFLGSVRKYWLEGSQYAAGVRVIIDVPNSPNIVKDPTVIMGLTLGAGALHALVFGSAAVSLMCAWTILLPHRASSWTCVVTAALSMILLMTLSFGLGFYLHLHTRIRWDFPIYGLPYQPMLQIWESVVAIPPVLILALWLFPRFGRVYETE